MRAFFICSAFAASFLLVGCGGGSGVAQQASAPMPQQYANGAMERALHAYINAPPGSNIYTAPLDYVQIKGKKSSLLVPASSSILHNADGSLTVAVPNEKEPIRIINGNEVSITRAEVATAFAVPPGQAIPAKYRQRATFLEVSH